MEPCVFLTVRQRDIAKSILEFVQSESVEDSFTAMISIMAASLNNKGDNGARSQIAAAHYAEMLINTVILGQEGKLQSHSHMRGTIQ